MSRLTDNGMPAVRALRARLPRWYRRNARALAWRGTDDPYVVLVSEFMLQQTQVARVAEKFDAWMRRFPDIRALAAASRRAVLLAWSGFGYNRRAVFIHECARAIVRDHGGVIPRDPAVLRTLPGIGRYTAHAVACLAYNARTPVVDVNIRRVLSRYFYAQTNESAMIPDAEAWRVAEEILPARNAPDWNQALMELGARVCIARGPRCDACPLRAACCSVGLMEQAARTPAGLVRETPRRIYRGKIVEYLRRAPDHRAAAIELGRHILPAFTAADLPWLDDIIGTLARDRLVSIEADNDVRLAQ